MYNSAKIKECLRGLVGLRQVYGEYEALDTALTDDVLFYLNDTHPLIDIENIYNSFRNIKKLGYKEFDITIEYKKDARIMYNDKAFKSLVDDNLNHKPTEENSTYWVEFNTISEQLLQSIDSSINKLVQSVFVLKKLNSTVKTIVDDFRLYDGSPVITNKNANNGRFVGFKFALKQKADLVITFPKISFQFDLACPDLKLYLFNTAQSEPVSVFELNYNQAGIVKWFDANNTSGFKINLNAFADGDYMLGYFETDLAPGAQSIKKETNLVAPESCSSCNAIDYGLYLRRSKYLNLQPFYVDSANLSGIELWDQGDGVYVEKNNFGMNLQITINCELSDFICRNKIIFAEALAKQAATDILLVMQYSTNDNQLLAKLKNQINYALHGSKDNNNLGLAKETEKAIKALDFDLSGLNAECLPCEDAKITGRRTM